MLNISKISAFPENLKVSFSLFILVVFNIVMSMTVTGCMSFNQKTLDGTTSYDAIYTFGDSNYDKQLKEGRTPTKLGPIVEEEIPINFPAKFLEPDGSYAGGRVYRTVAEAERAIRDAKQNGLISETQDWGIYQLKGNWDELTYEYRPGDYRLRQSTLVLRRVY